MPRVILSNSTICGPLNEYVPSVILKEIYYDHFDNVGAPIEPKEIEFTQNGEQVVLKDDDLPYIAYFLNPNMGWPINKLIESFKNHLTYLVPLKCNVELSSNEVSLNETSLNESNSEVNEVSLNYTSEQVVGSCTFCSTSSLAFGIPSPHNTHVLKPACLFRICRVHQIPTTSSTTIPQMLHMIQHLHKSSPNLKLQILEHLDGLNSKQLVSLLSQVLICERTVELDVHEPCQTPALDAVVGEDDQNEQNEEETQNPAPQQPLFYESLISCFNDFDNKTYLQRHAKPRTAIEACVLAAINFEYDLSDAKNALLEYSRLESYPFSYVPGDAGMYKKFEQDEFCYRLDYIFNPHLPKTFYFETRLKELAIEEGFVEDDFRASDPYELLQFGCLSSTFYHGKLETIINTETPILCEPIVDLKSASIISYGVKNEAVVALGYKELTRFWKHQCAFTNPVCSTDTVEARSVRKLKKLCTYIRASDTLEEMKVRQDLYDCIIFVESFIQEKGHSGLQLLKSFRDSSNEQKTVYKNIFSALLELIMYMRGWSGTGSFEQAVLRAPVDNQNDVDMCVTQALAHFEELCTVHPEIGNLIQDLPLLKYRNAQFIAVSDSSQGQTIKERIDLIKQGEQADVLASCIRVSSNLLGASYFRYSSILDFKKEFEISDLRSIS